MAKEESYDRTDEKVEMEIKLTPKKVKKSLDEVLANLEKEVDEKTVSVIFKLKPESWGGRGDPYLWDELEQVFTTIPLPCSKTYFIDLFEKFFQKITNHPFERGDEIFVEKYDHGGMSSGYISIEFWRKEGLPLLLNRLEKVNIEG